MPLLDGWFVHEQQTRGKAHRLRTLPAFPEYAAVLCDGYWLLASARSTEVVDHCHNCERIEHRYTARDEAK